MYRRDMPNTQAATRGLYDPRFEHDSCGVSFVVDMKGRRSHELLDLAFQSLCNLEHRGAAGAEVETGDGAGILIQMPDALFRAVVDFELPPEGAYATGMVFLARDDEMLAADQRDAVDEAARRRGFRAPRPPRGAHRHRRDRGLGAAGHAGVRPDLRVEGRPRREPAHRYRARAARVSSRARGSSTRSASTCRRSRRARSSTRAC